MRTRILFEREGTARRIIEYISKNGADYTSLSDLLAMCQRAESEGEIHHHSEFWIKTANWAKKLCIKKHIETQEDSYGELYDDYLLWETPYSLDSFILYMEKDRPYERKFYEPRRKTLLQVVNALQDLEDRKYKFLGISMPSRTGKSTVCIFFLTWIACKRPNSHNGMGGHSGILAKGFYNEFMNFITTDEYTFRTIYSRMHPGKNQMLQAKSAEEFTVTLGRPDRFATLTCRGIDGTWTGAVDISKDGYLYVDDLIRDREHSLSPIRMENTFQEYLNKMVDRKNDGARELMVGTLWNVMDPLERMRHKYSDDPEYHFLKIPALDFITDESNFQYDVNGFSTQYYRDMRERLDRAEWMAKYQQEPFVREGLLFPPDELRFFNGILPEGDSKVVAACDVAFGGGDSLSMPIGREYEDGSVYIIDWIFSTAPKEFTVPMVVAAIIRHGIRAIQFEGNNGGDMYADYVEKELADQNYKCTVKSKKAPNTMEKTTKIEAYSGDIKRKFYFLQPKSKVSNDMFTGAYERSADYERAINEMTTFVTIGKNEHDDAVDGITQLAMAVEEPFNPYKTKITRGGRL